MIDFQFRKMDLFFRFPDEMKKLTFDPVVSIWVKFGEKVHIVNCSNISENFQAFFGIRNMRFFQKKSWKKVFVKKFA